MKPKTAIKPDIITKSPVVAKSTASPSQKNTTYSIGVCSGMTSGKGSSTNTNTQFPSWISKSPIEPDTGNSIKKLQDSQKVDVLFDGDSITAQLGVDGNGALTKYLPGISTIVTAVPGDTTGYMMYRWRQQNAFPKAKVFVIGIGTNDLTLEPSSIVERHATIRDLLRSKYPKSSIVFTALWWRNGMVDRVDQTNALLKKMVESSDSRIFYAPHTRTSCNSASDFLDGVHPNPAAWNKALEGLAPCISAALSKAS